MPGKGPPMSEANALAEAKAVSLTCFYMGRPGVSGPNTIIQ
jgi:hypothetical protein